MAGVILSPSLDVFELQKDAREQLVEILKGVPGQKDLALDSCLMKPLDRISGAALLKKNGVDKIFKLEPGKTLSGCDKRLYMVRPTIACMQQIADQINSERSLGQKRQYKIICVPRKLCHCEHILEREGVFGYVTVTEYHLYLVPIDKDIASLEIPDLFRSFYLNSDYTWLHTVAQSLVNVQQIFGYIPNVYGIGRCAQMVNDLVKTLFETVGQPKPLNDGIGHLILIDRNIDYVTPLCSQVTYEGLLDDIFGIVCGSVEFDNKVTNSDQKVKLTLSSQDAVFEMIRNRHFTYVFPYLSSKAKELQTRYDKRHALTSVTEMKEFVDKELKDLNQQHKSLSLHIGASEHIIKSKVDLEELLQTEHSLLEGVDTKDSVNYIEELINRQNGMNNCLRLLCLLSLTQGGLQPQLYQSLKTQFLQSFGCENLLMFHNLKRLGIITELGGQMTAPKQIANAVASAANLPKACPFRSLCKKLNLIPKSAEEVNLKVPNDMSYVFSGAYTPLSCKLIEQVLVREGFGGLDDIIRMIPEPTFVNKSARSAKGSSVNDPPSSKTVLVYFLGGCTYSEIIALRYLGHLKGYNFIIATTSLINGDRLLDMVSEKTK